MIGSIVGDIAGSPYEFNNYKAKDCELFNKKSRFTDDTAMTIAVYNALKECNGDYSHLEEITIKQMQKIGREHYNVGYGGMFKRWIKLADPYPYYSVGNGAAMRISPVAEFAKTEEEVKYLSRKITGVTHNSQEGYRGAEAIAMATFLAKHGANKEQIKARMKEYYSLDYNYNDLVKNYSFDVTCDGSVPVAIYCFLISNSFEDFLRTTISVGGDTDTLCAIAGSIAEYYFGIEKEFVDRAMSFLTPDLLDYIKDELNQTCTK